MFAVIGMRGRVRTRSINPKVKATIARMAMEGRIGRSGAMLARGLQRFAKWKSLGSSSANEALRQDFVSYLFCRAECLSGSSCVSLQLCHGRHTA